MPSPLDNTKLFAPLKLGRVTLKHRVIMAPLTRVRSPEHIPGDEVVKYYSQRASEGGLIISEAAHISVMGGNYHGAPGVFSPEHLRAWKKVTKAVHAKGGYIFCQLWHIGRAAHPVSLGGRSPLAPSAGKISEGMIFFTPKGALPYEEAVEMTSEDITNTISDYVHAASTAIAAGFDGVEVHSANGYLLDQFLCDNINKRTDKYGGSTKNRSRLTLEVVDAVASAIGADRVGIRFSPFGFFQDTRSSDIIGQFGHVVGECDKRGLAYVHLVEPRNDLFNGQDTKVQQLKELAKSQGVTEEEMLSLKPFKDLLKNTPLVACGNFNAENSKEPIQSGAVDAIAYGRIFIANPDLPHRLEKGLQLNRYNRDTFYTNGPEGYTDYPTYAEARL